MNKINQSESPLLIKVSFNKLLQQYDELAKSKDTFLASKAKHILKTQKPYPVLREGFTDLSLLKTYEKEIAVMLQDSFSKVLTLNEIKTASLPFENVIFNSSQRFKNMIKTAGEDFELEIKNMPNDHKYIIACTVVLNFCYGYNLNFRRPFFYEIPDTNGIMRYYKILYNADFTEIVPTKKAKKITKQDYEELLDNFDNLDLWKEKFPPNSYEFKGFIISNIFDVTDDQSISNIKSNLIADNKDKDESFSENLHNIFRSLFNMNDIKIGFSVYDINSDRFEHVFGGGIHSFLLNINEEAESTKILCKGSYNTLVTKNKFYTVSDVDKFYKLSKGKAPQYKALKEQHIKSAILAPIVNDDDELLGILEIVSNKKHQLNSITANKLVDVMPFILTSVQRSKREEDNLVEAIIQQECTSIHPSVHWRFQEEAKRFLNEQMHGKDDVSFNKIAFENIYPLYGQIDIKGSSEARNTATQKDLTLQLNNAKSIIEKANNKKQLPIYEQIIYQINSFLNGLKTHFQVDSEQQISTFFKEEITPIFRHFLATNIIAKDVEDYFNKIDKKVNMLYKHRRNYDDTISLINKEMAYMLDKKQEEAQQMYPHYFERYKTDGVEHNMYIGESITKENSFNPIYLYNLRLWQLQVMCEMENSYYQMQTNLPVQLDVASMILVFNQPLSISFRMDEKQFDVDGTYNARYEIVKKRVDKAYIKGTKKRITEKGKIAIVYSQKKDEIEYLRYIKFLQSKHYLDTDVEIVELQDLQAVTGLKAIRVSVLYHKNKNDKTFFTYNDLMKEIKA